MTAYPIPNPFSQWNDVTGLPLTSGYIWIGEPSQNPETHPIAVYQDAGLSVPFTQPLRTVGGFLVGTGTPVNAYPSSTPYSISVRNKANVEVYYRAEVHDEIADAIAEIEALLPDAAGVIELDQSASYPTATLGAHDQNFVCVTDAPFNAVADGTWSGSAASGTDNYAAFTAALALCATKGKRLYVPAGVYYLAQGITLPVRPLGDGSPGFGAFVDGVRTGTCLLINTQSGADAIKLPENTRNAGFDEMLVLNTTANGRSGINATGVLYPRFHNAEIGSLVKTDADGYYAGASTTGAQFESLYGAIGNLICDQSPTAGFRYGYNLRGVTASPSKRANDNGFSFGKFAGWKGCGLIAADVAGAGPKGLSFSQVTHEMTYTTNAGVPNMEVVYVDTGSKVAGYASADPVYVAKLLNITDATQISFSQCWMGCGGLPSTYNDGTNGTWPILAAVWLDNKAHVSAVEIIGPAWDGVYIYDNASNTKVSQTVDFREYSGSAGIQLLLSSDTTTAITGSMAKIPFDVDQGDNYITWNNDTGTVWSDGTYAFEGMIGIAGVAAADNTNAQIRLVAGGFTRDGTTIGATGTTMTPSISTMVPMYQGEQFYLMGQQNSGSNKNLSGDAKQNRLTVVKI